VGVVSLVVSLDGSRLATFVVEFSATQRVSRNARFIVITRELVFSTYDNFSLDGSLAVSKRRFANKVSASILGNANLPFPVRLQCIPYRPKSQQLPVTGIAYAEYEDKAENEDEVEMGDLMFGEDEEAWHLHLSSKDRR
jgi:hypothetical protein